MKTIARQISAQWAIGKNLGESSFRRLFRMVLALCYLAKALRCGIKSLRHEQLGSKVIHNGQRCWISNWANSETPTLCGPDFYRERVPRSEIKNIVSIKELIHRFEFGLSFYLNSWHGIDVQNRLYPHLKRW